MISDTVLDAVTATVMEAGTSEETVVALRATWPKVHFTYCMDDDIAGKAPVRRTEAFNLYLVDARAHCLTITQDPEAATGLVIAEKLEGDD